MRHAPPLVTVVVPALGNVDVDGIADRTDQRPQRHADRRRRRRRAASPRCWSSRAIASSTGRCWRDSIRSTAQSQVDSAQASLEELKADAASAQAEYARASEGARFVLGGGIRTPPHRRADRGGQGQGRRSAAGRCAQRAGSAPPSWRPSDGIVLTRTAEVGQIAMPGSHGAVPAGARRRRSKCAAKWPSRTCRGSRWDRERRCGSTASPTPLPARSGRSAPSSIRRHAAGHGAHRAAGRGSESAAGRICARRHPGRRHRGRDRAADRGARAMSRAPTR